VATVWLLLVLTVIGGLTQPRFRSYSRGQDPSDWIQFVPDTLAALIAVALGVPTGLWVSHQIERSRQQDERAQRTLRLRQVLAALMEEVQFNKQQMDLLLEYTGKPQDFIPQFDYRIEVWRALSASGDLSLIEAPALLSQLAVAASHAEGVNRWRRSLRENYASLHYLDAGLGKDAANRVWPELIKATKGAADVLDTMLKRLTEASVTIDQNAKNPTDPHSSTTSASPKG
jgi:hypothetical protein